MAFPVKWFAFLTVHGGEQMSCERSRCWCTQDWAGKLGRPFIVGSQTDPSDGGCPRSRLLKCTWVFRFFPTFVFVYAFNWVAFHLPFIVTDLFFFLIYHLTVCFLCNLPVLSSFLDFFWVKWKVILFSMFIDGLVNSLTLLSVINLESTGLHPWLFTV